MNYEAVQFIERNRQRPFFLYLSHYAPHSILNGKPAIVDKYRRKHPPGKSVRKRCYLCQDAGKQGDPGNHWAPDHNPHLAAMLESIDDGVGRILAKLEELKLDKNTLVIFTSDNGPWLLYGDHSGSAGPLREGKATPFEGGFRVPCIMWWPGKIPAGSRCDELASTIDILPTIARLGGAPLPKKKIVCMDRWPLMTAQPGAKSPHEAFFYYSGSRLSGVRSGKWKLLFAQGFTQQKPPGKGGQPGNRATGRIPLSLFDLEKDVGEKVNVAAAHPGVVKRLQGLAEEMRKELGDTGRPGSGIRPVGR